MNDTKVTRLKKWIRGDRPGPFKMQLQNTEFCNLKCHTCALRQFDDMTRPKSQEMAPEELLSVIEQAAVLGVKRVEFVGGGEPTLNPEAALQYCMAIKEYDMFGSLTTNGTLFNSHMIHTMVEIDWDRIEFSVDAPDEQTHDFLRGVQGTYKKVIHTICEFVSVKKQLGKSKPHLALTPVLTRLAARRVGDFIKFTSELGLHELNFRPMYITTEKARELLPTESDIEQFHRDYPTNEKLAEKLGLMTNIGDLFSRSEVVEENADMHKPLSDCSKNSNETEGSEPSEPKMEDALIDAPCFEPWWIIGIQEDGFVYPCTASGDYKIENVRKKSLKEIWTGPFFRSFREKILSGEFPECCTTCCPVSYLDNQMIRKGLMS